jgi:hypothetical protein
MSCGNYRFFAKKSSIGFLLRSIASRLVFAEVRALAVKCPSTQKRNVYLRPCAFFDGGHAFAHQNAMG